MSSISRLPLAVLRDIATEWSTDDATDLSIQSVNNAAMDLFYTIAIPRAAANPPHLAHRHINNKHQNAYSATELTTDAAGTPLRSAEANNLRSHLVRWTDAARSWAQGIALLRTHYDSSVDIRQLYSDLTSATDAFVRFLQTILGLKSRESELEHGHMSGYAVHEEAFAPSLGYGESTGSQPAAWDPYNHVLNELFDADPYFDEPSMIGAQAAQNVRFIAHEYDRLWRSSVKSLARQLLAFLRAARSMREVLSVRQSSGNFYR